MSVCPRIGSFLVGFPFLSVFCFLFSVFCFVFCIHNIFTCISHWGLLYVQHERINKMQAKLHENQSKPQPSRVELSAILGVASCRGTCQGCQHLTDLIISILFLSLSRSVSYCLSGYLSVPHNVARRACCVLHSTCIMSDRNEKIWHLCDNKVCFALMLPTSPSVCWTLPGQARPGQTRCLAVLLLLFLLLPPVVPHGAAGAATISLAAFCMRLNYVDNCP